MPGVSSARTTIQRNGSDRARRIRSRISADVRDARKDAGLSLRRLSRAAGISHATLLALERGAHDPTTEVLARVGEALGMDLSVRLYPGSGPLIRDHLQAAMIEALLDALHERWRPSPEIWVTRPVRGVIDLLLESADAREPLVVMEAQSELRRLERQIRWAHAKSAALREARGRAVSQLLLLRSTRHTRSVVAQHAQTISSAYPADAADAFAALTGPLAWPGSALVWCDIERGQARLRSIPPRGITIGR